MILDKSGIKIPLLLLISPEKRKETVNKNDFQNGLQNCLTIYQLSHLSLSVLGEALYQGRMWRPGGGKLAREVQEAGRTQQKGRKTRSKVPGLSAVVL